MTQSLPFTVYHGTFVHPKDLKHLDIILHGSIGVDTTGTIVFVDRESLTAKEAFDKWEKSSKETHSSSIEESNVQFIEISDSLASFFFPGFFDTHIVSTDNKPVNTKNLTILASTLHNTQTAAYLVNPLCSIG